MQDKSSNLEILLQQGVIAVVRAASSEEALKVVDALREGEIKTIEITMTVPGALKVMEEVTKKLGQDILLGAGTVLDAETARLSILSGAQFVVGPCLDLDLIRICQRYSKIVIPGAMTPTEILQAWQAGADLVKVFPAGNLGGPSYIKAIKAPLPQVLLNPTGGVNLDTTADFIRAGASVISAGSALVDKQAIEEANFQVITEKAGKFVEEVRRGRSN